MWCRVWSVFRTQLPHLSCDNNGVCDLSVAECRSSFRYAPAKTSNSIYSVQLFACFHSYGCAWNVLSPVPCDVLLSPTEERKTVCYLAGS